ncbi:MAG: glycosyltransferase [Candidatus Eisenbacteria bacterium]|uniref:Glycosyltransferase n=1 Tax=Eiseniibacteriota bacterium TaxID=2212470 RepID=A0A938BNV6_UNCEI|nr:glycosyltransferase [Candidatus Eisenbacteria bacterium]
MAPDISIIVPARDEAATIPQLAAEIEAAMGASGRDWECLWIDDGSVDDTLLRLRELRARRGEHHFLSLDRGYGQSAALAVGFLRARGRVLVTLDADLQNDPADIPRLLAELEAGPAAMVQGVRIRRRDRWLRRASSRVANGFRNRVTGEAIRDIGCALRALRAECVERIPLFRGMHRFLPTLVRMGGWGVVEIPVAHRPRGGGRAKYGIRNRLWAGLLDTFGVRWWRSRRVLPRVRCSSMEGELGDHAAEW